MHLDLYSSAKGRGILSVVKQIGDTLAGDIMVTACLQRQLDKQSDVSTFLILK